jgi:hypothetical protein
MRDKFEIRNLMATQKVRKRPILSFRRIPDRGPGQAAESRKNKHLWTPASAGVTTLATFCEGINLGF